MNKFKSALNSKGYIIREVSLQKIKNPFKEPLKRTKKEILQKFSDKIHSIYVYGSVVTGEATSPTSDLDILVILKRKPSSSLESEFKKLEAELSKVYDKKFREVGIEVAWKNTVLKGKEPLGWAFFIQIICIKIYGDTLYEKTRSYKPTKQLAKQLHGDLRNVLKDYKLKIEKETDKNKLNLYSKSIMKKLIRTAFSMVMEAENEWTTNLEYMVQIFSKYYPDKKKEITLTLYYAQQSSSNKKEVLNFLNSFGNWLAKEFDKKM